MKHLCYISPTVAQYPKSTSVVPQQNFSLKHVYCKKARPVILLTIGHHQAVQASFLWATKCIFRSCKFPKLHHQGRSSMARYLQSRCSTERGLSTFQSNNSGRNCSLAAKEASAARFMKGTHARLTSFLEKNIVLCRFKCTQRGN